MLCSMKWRISWGTPGTEAMARDPCSTMNPGAVPTGFSMGMAPSGMKACLRLFSLIFRPSRVKKSLIWSQRA